MLNAEKYRSQILEFIDKEKTMYFSFKNDNANMFNQCCETNCYYCALCSGDSTKEPCTITRIKWLLSEYKEPVKLTELEHGILEYLLEKKQYRFVVRERNDCLYIYKSKPKKEADSWESLSLNNELGLFNNLFQFVQWEDSEPTSIEYVLNNCEVVNDAEE